MDAQQATQHLPGYISAPLPAHNYLKDFHLLSRLSESQLSRVHQHARTTTLKKEEYLFNQGDRIRYFYLVISGKIKLSRISPKGEEKIIDIITDGQMFAEALMFKEDARFPVTATAISKSEIVCIDAADFTVMLRDSMDTCFLLLGELSSRMHSLIHEIGNLSLHTGTCRVASYIMENAPNGNNCFKLNVAKSVIASRLSIKPETFSRIIKELHQNGVLSVEGCDITIHNRDALMEMCISSN